MRFITIEREYGSGATQIAKELAKQCNVNCYGKEILEYASSKMNISPEKIAESEEKATSSIMYSLFMLSQAANGNSDMLSMNERVFSEEQNAIRAFAGNGSAIFLGHCAYEALKDREDVISVFIHADEESKMQRIKTEYGISEDKADAVAKKNNKRRATYYHANTQKKWDDIKNYDIVIDSSKLGIDGCIKVLKGLLN